MDEKVAILKHRVHAKSLPSNYDLVDHSVDDIEKMLARAQSTIDQSTRTILASRRQKKIGQFKYDMLTLTVATGEEIARSLEKRIKEEKTKFLAINGTDGNNASSVQWLTRLMAAIEKRQAHMIQRAQYITNDKIHSFFDEAPATYDDLNNNSVVGAKS
jgi:DNA replication initiation complex subunit (GINS family)